MSHFNEAGSPDALNMAKSVAYQSECRVDVHGANARAAARALRWILRMDHVVADGVMPLLVEGLDSERK
eukprot:6205489-Pleurochrysis_carterae.AAC.1